MEIVNQQANSTLYDRIKQTIEDTFGSTVLVRAEGIKYFDDMPYYRRLFIWSEKRDNWLDEIMEKLEIEVGRNDKVILYVAPVNGYTTPIIIDCEEERQRQLQTVADSTENTSTINC